MIDVKKILNFIGSKRRNSLLFDRKVAWGILSTILIDPPQQENIMYAIQTKTAKQFNLIILFWRAFKCEFSAISDSFGARIMWLWY